MSPREESRQRILQAAFEAFSAVGYEKASMDDIVQRSGLSKGSLYWHFKNKQELFVAMMAWVFEQFTSQIEGMADQTAPAADRIRVFFGTSMEWFESTPHMMGLLIDAFFQSYRSPVAREVLTSFYQRYIHVVETVIKQGIENGEFRADIDPHAVAISLMAGGDGVAIYTLLEPGWNLSGAVEALMDLVLRGIAANPEE